jgi:hypothetical protein
VVCSPAAFHRNRQCFLAAKQSERYGQRAREDPGIGAGIKIGRTDL